MSHPPHQPASDTGQPAHAVVNGDDEAARLTGWLAGQPLLPARPTPPSPAARPPAAPTRPAGFGVTNYGAAALKGEVDDLAHTTTGGRNHQANLAAYKLAGHIAGGHLTEQAITDALYQACVANGLVRDDGERSVRATIRSGLAAGGLAPRVKGERELPAPAPVFVLPPPPVAAAGQGDTTAAAGDQDQAPAPATDARPSIDVTGSDAAAIRALHDAITAQKIPDLYVTDGAIVRLEAVSGDLTTALTAGPTPPPAPVLSGVLGAAGFASLLARRTYCYAVKKTKEGKAFTAETTPSGRLLDAVLADRHWPGVRPLHGIVTTPVLRPDGSLLQAAGYDEPTGLFHAPKVAMPAVPAAPTPEEVAASRTFLFDELLSGFPWVEGADLAGYLGLLVTPILRPFLRTLTPFGLIIATTASSGKSLLTELPGALFGSRIVTWPRGDDAELRKAITTVLSTAAPVVVWDNLREGSMLDSPILAQLITAPVWSDRLLGTMRNVSAANDRLWLATGNNLRLGGDMATRTALVRLDPKMPHPEERTGFKIPHLDQWIKQSEAQRTVLWHLLVLVADWIANGAPRTDHVMRQFTGWAQGIGGFLQHHGVGGFLDNLTAIREMDDDDNEWVVFLGRWYELYQDRELTTAALLASAETDFTPQIGVVDKWEGAFLADERTTGRPSAKSLGRRLGGQVGRFHGEHVLHRGKDPHTKMAVWSVRHVEDPPTS